MSSSLYSGPIIDAHHHLWDLSMGKHHWLLPSDSSIQALGGLQDIAHDYLVEDYVRDSAGQDVVASVHIEALWDADDLVGETRWLETLDKSRNVATRYVARAPLATPQAEAVLAQQAAFDRVVGIRDILSWHPDPTKCFVLRPDLAEDPAWRRGLALLPKYGLTFELMMYPYQAGMVADLARTFPNLQFVVNHCGSPIDRDPEGMRRWRDGLRAVARHPNVAIKISNIAGYDKAWTPQSLSDVAMHCLDCFGADRSMLGTDYPVARLNMNFAQIYESFRQIFAGLSPSEQRALFHDNAQRIYRLGDLVTPAPG